MAILDRILRHKGRKLDFRKQDQIAEIIIKVNGNKLAVKETSEDMYKSITLGVGKLERMLKKYKGKMRHFEKERIVENIVEEIDIDVDVDVDVDVGIDIEEM